MPLPRSASDTRVAWLYALRPKFSEPSGSEQPSGIIGLGLDFSDAISRRVLLDTASLVEGNNVVPLPRLARE
jgi:hypothetical protein